MVEPHKKARLAWNCRRGMLELDIILQQFFDKHVDSLTESQITAFESLLASNDPELYSWLMGHAEPSQSELIEIVQLIKHSN